MADTDADGDDAATGGEGSDTDPVDGAEPESPPAPTGGLVVPVEPTPTLRATIAYAVEAAVDEGFSAVHLVNIASWRNGDPGTDDRAASAERVLERAEAWATSDLDDIDGERPPVTVVTAVIGADEYLFGPDDYVDVLAAYAEGNDADAVLLDPEYTPVGNTTLLQPLEFALSNTPLTVETAPVARPSRRERLRTEATGRRFVAMFGLSLAFYFLLGDPLYWFDWVTGVATAAIVSITLSRVSIDVEPSMPRTPMRMLRGLIYVPVLLYEITKANVEVARVILDPRLPIEPSMNRVRVIVGSGLPLMTLANSITLTPGTLTVRARDSDLYVHSLIPSARDGLFDGSLERWTRFVYYGRASARLPTPRERDDCAILQGPDATEELPIAAADGGESRAGGETATAGDGDSPGERGDEDDETPEVTDA
ncbi:monovalent cation/H+ antiporter subunit E [Halorubrum kocurii]|uniref:Monovalent cation/H+ antiporter subunit E n=1 Tax=Halorubrum kocurii JCM 14978 TaxID=1230456 RepID=M0NS40_9EURY|nr:monovalent cation/H+ antiporter subunit E [Halorubrum kocurii]EMA60029.1 monovalent cation/H+ antiporter subunit E [Halorubrum kocurii JCM 14978]WKF46080.1 monovalent cation/H+ antiporter subunit E [Halorubrum kocurii]